MSARAYVYAAWAAGSIALFAWFAIRHLNDPQRFKDKVTAYPLLPSTTAFAWTTYALGATLWPAVMVAAAVESIRTHDRSVP